MHNDTERVSVDELHESVEELRNRLETMKLLMKSGKDGSVPGVDPARTKHSDSIIDGSFLSVVFGVVLTMIVSVSFYAFQNLYFAILKKFPTHTEL